MKADFNKTAYPTFWTGYNDSRGLVRKGDRRDSQNLGRSGGYPRGQEACGVPDARDRHLKNKEMCFGNKKHIHRRIYIHREKL